MISRRDGFQKRESCAGASCFTMRFSRARISSERIYSAFTGERQEPSIALASKNSRLLIAALKNYC